MKNIDNLHAFFFIFEKLFQKNILSFAPVFAMQFQAFSVEIFFKSFIIFNLK